ncbi:SDR family oxidoreductase [Pseudoglutamicibacter cumminsii]|uniref:SDR family oxidoreductase n=1 Tax=Pseudoglutamicibacter cumminsii TaxID=156979 RepID=UPI00255397FC|nr:SDR family oxidoreductase [Pseudoglutamicibacter cumminsii]MDK7083306.1 SDR family oxidoreductase [Pseudoglutamicibacter cumminsii]MDZ3744584.1 SDR family oxidoreductase [Pseudoglutamicibacter cumminsii]
MTTSHDSDKPVALITGASRGIGLAIARELASTHELILGASSEDSLADVLAEFPGARPFIVELTDKDAIARAVADAGFGGGEGDAGGAGARLDVLVHSAGVADGETVAETPWDVYERVFAVNVFAVAELTRLLLPALRAAGGQVVTINSGSGYFSGVGAAVYSGSKFALRAFSDALREEERGAVRVTSIHPGRVDTDMQMELQASYGNHDYDGSLYIRPESVAATVRLAVDATPEAMIENLAIRPVHK